MPEAFPIHARIDPRIEKGVFVLVTRETWEVNLTVVVEVAFDANPDRKTLLEAIVENVIDKLGNCTTDDFAATINELRLVDRQLDV